MRKVRLDKKFLNRWLNRLEIKLQRKKLLSKPVYLTIEPTNACNSRCIMCNKFKEYETKEFKPGFMSREIFEKIIPWAKYASSTCWGGFGEPFLHPQYGHWAEELKKNGANLTTFTNGIKMDRSLARKLVEIQFDSIHISLGGSTEDIYKKIRGIFGFERMLENLEYLNEIKRRNNSKKPFIYFSLVAMNSVLPQLNDIVRLAKKYGIASLELPDLNVQYPENIKESIWTGIDEAKKIINNAWRLSNEIGVKFHPPTLEEKIEECHDFFNLIQITHDGKVLSCSNEKFLTGDLKLETIEEIWNNKKYLRLRREYFYKGIAKICPDCQQWNKSKELMLKPTINLRDNSIDYKKNIKKNKVMYF